MRQIITKTLKIIFFVALEVLLVLKDNFSRVLDQSQKMMEILTFDYIIDESTFAWQR